MPAVGNLVAETTSGTGTGALQLAAANGKQRFSQAFATGGADTFDYFISNQDGTQWERGTGSVSAANALTRDTVLENSNGDTNPVDFPAGLKDVANDVPAAKQVQTDLAQTLSGPKTLASPVLTGTVTGPSGTWDAGGLDIATGDSYAVNGTDVLTATALGVTVLSSSLTSVGALNAGSITTGFGNIDNGTSNITTGGILKVDTDGTAINSAGSATFGAGNDASIYWNGANLSIDTTTGMVFELNGSTDFTYTSNEFAANTGSKFTVAGDGSGIGNPGAITFGVGSDGAVYSDGANLHVDVATALHLALSGAEFCNWDANDCNITSDVLIGSLSNDPYRSFHVQDSANTVTDSWTADVQAVFERAGNAGIGIMSSAAGVGSIKFGIPSDIDNGRISVNHSTDVMSFFAGGVERFEFDGNGNLLLGTIASPASAVNSFVINTGTAPTGSVTNATILYSEDVSASAELKVRDEAGNVTVLSPHNFELYDPAPDDPYPWSYHSRNDYLGEEINVDMSGAIRALEKLTGETFIHRRKTEKTDWQESRREGLRLLREAEIGKLMEEDEMTREEAEKQVPESTVKPLPAWLAARL